MSQRNNSCDCCSSSSSGFVFGLICGAIIAALVAIYVYRNPKSEVFQNLKKKFDEFFKTKSSPPPKNHKKSVTLPPMLAVTTPPSAPKIKAKKFLKPKK